MPVKPIPDGYHAITPYLIVKGAADAIAYYVKAFGAKEIDRMEGDGGKVAHAEIQIGDSRMMLADEVTEMGFCAPEPGSNKLPVSLMLYVEDVDSVVPRAIEAGAAVIRPLTTQFYGDRSATLRDPFGHVWTISTHVEDVSHEEMVRRMEAGAGH